jgi:hypothetical protein
LARLSYQILLLRDQTIPPFAILADNSNCDDRQLPIGVLARPSFLAAGSFDLAAGLISLVIWGNMAFARALAFLINAERNRRERNRASRAQIAIR